MDELEDFLQGSFLARPRNPPKCLNISRKSAEEKKEKSVYRDSEKSLDYATKIKIAEENATRKRILNDPLDETLGIDENEESRMTLPTDEIFEKYDFNIPSLNLPIKAKRDEIITELKRNNIIIIRAATGSGKSSQVPQYILEEAYKTNQHVNIVITQPRRLSAKTLAHRVAEERNCEVGSLVGYQIGQDRQIARSDSTRILFCTTGVLLQKLVNEKSLANWTHIIIDEIHERDVDLDFVLLIIPRISNAHKSNTKIILMSATMETEHLAKYFSAIKRPKILELDVERPFFTSINYLDVFEKHEFYSSILNSIDLENPGICPFLNNAGVEILKYLIFYKEFKSFLIFLPGWFEIEMFRKVLAKEEEIVKNFNILVLHSTMGMDNLKPLYDSQILYKIILATNVAESSMTIPNIDYVIDFCLTKHLETDTTSNMTQLVMKYASKTNLTQRAGRVGRTKPGHVIRMIFKKDYEKLEDEAPPEMQRASLEIVILKAKKLNMGTPVDILGLALSPPTRPAIKDAILILKELGALTRYQNDWFDYCDGDLTFIGNIMCNLPVDVRLSKLIFLGYIFKVFHETIIIASGLSVRSIFLKNQRDDFNAYKSKFELGMGSCDCIAILEMYKRWREFCRRYDNADYDTYKKEEEKFSNRYNVDAINLKDMKSQIEDIKNRLKQFNLVDHQNDNDDEEKILFRIKICIAGAFYPNFYIFGGQKIDRETYNQLNYKNPCNSIMFTGFPSAATRHDLKHPIFEQYGKIYKNKIIAYLRNKGVIDCENHAEVFFDSSSSRVVVEFKNNYNKMKVPGDVVFEMYKAARLALLNRHNELKFEMIPEREEREYLKRKLEEFTIKDPSSANDCIYPKTNDEITGNFSYIISPGKFYIQPNLERLQKFHETILNGKDMIPIDNINECCKKNLIIVNISHKFYRAQIIESFYYNQRLFKVQLIDYGDIVRCKLSDLYTISGSSVKLRKSYLMKLFMISPLCFEAKLALSKPAPTQQCGWNEASIEKFKEIIAKYRKKISIKIFSFNTFDKVASVVLNLKTNEYGLPTVNDIMLTNNFSTIANESHIFMISKINREKYNESKNDHYDFMDFRDAPRGRKRIALRGPFTNLHLKTFEKTSDCNAEIKIDLSSVNSVLFDPYPFDGVRKVLIAANRSKNEKGNIILRQTTLMPHVNGMASLLSLIFSPKVQLRYDKHINRITSILSGLGCSWDGHSYFEEHDNIINVDVDLDNKDFDFINKLRNTMTTIMDNFVILTEDELKILRNNAVYQLMHIMEKPRNQVGIIQSGFTSYRWNSDSRINSSRELQKTYSKIDVLQLQPLSYDHWKSLMSSCNRLEKDARYESKDMERRCQLCLESLETLIDLQVHVENFKHVKLANKLKNEEPDEMKAVKRERIDDEETQNVEKY